MAYALNEVYNKNRVCDNLTVSKTNKIRRVRKCISVLIVEAD